MTKQTAAEAASKNMAVFMERGPGMDYRYRSFIVAKDSKNRMVTIGGLGCMGVGQMNFPMSDNHKDYPGWDDVPETTIEPRTGFFKETL